MFVIARFRREIPNIDGMRMVVALDNYQIFEVTAGALSNWPENIEYEEITDLEGTTAWKFYAEVRPYRSAYSDVEGLVPDSTNSRGVNKTKVPFDWDIYNAVVTLMKRIFKRNIKDVFAERGTTEGQQEILDMIDGLNTIRDISYERERLLGIEMSKTQLKELYLWDEEKDMRIGRHQYTLGF
jgi:hypothetical protein